MIKAVIFDFDDTLVEARLQKWAHHKHVGKKFYNIDVTDEELKKHWGKPIPVLMAELYKNSDTMENMYKALISVRDDFRKKVYPGSFGVISNLVNKGYVLGILSASNKKYIIEELEEHNFPMNKILIQGAEDTEVHKPDPGVFLLILEKLEKEGIMKEEIVYIGDSMMDFQAASGAGLDFIAVTTGLYSKENFEKAGATKIVDSIEKVLQYL
jgi:phosphoglycolate phosphatase-like HAD superfamily hydrolase